MNAKNHAECVGQPTMSGITARNESEDEKRRKEEAPDHNHRRKSKLGNAANADLVQPGLVQQISKLIGAALITQQDIGNGGSVDWGIDDNRPLNGQERR